MIGDKKHRTKQGFTIVEVLVALAIFSVVITIATGFFYSAYRIQHKTEALQNLSTTARFIMERLVREIKENVVDYTYDKYVLNDSELSLPQTVLALKDFENQPIIFKKFDSGEVDGCPNGACLKMSIDDSEWSSLMPDNIRLMDDGVKFYITPQKDPFRFDSKKLGYESNQQPYVLIVLSLENVNVRPSEKASITLQTGVSSRVYKR